MTNILKPRARKTTNISSVPGKKILISGASSWLGRNLLEILYNDLSKADREVIVVSDRLEHLAIGKQPISIYRWSDLANHSFDLFFNLAFPPRPKIRENLQFQYDVIELQKKFCSLLNKNNFGSVLFTSSGAAERYAGYPGTDKTYNPYGYAKLQFEDLIMEKCGTLDFKYSILRIFSVSGLYCPRPNDFAITSMLSEFRATGDIHVKAKINVVRQYISIKDLIHGWLYFHERHPDKRIDSGGEKASLTHLRSLIFSALGNGDIEPKSNDTESYREDVYVSTTYNLFEFLKDSGRRPIGLKDQIREMASEEKTSANWSWNENE